jgi:Ca-activated chloride channel family protein
MTFAKPQFLPLLTLIPILWLFIAWARERNTHLITKLGNPVLLGRLSAGVNHRNRVWKDLLKLTALTMIILSLARPQWGREVREINQEGLQVIVALDVSQSMLVEDVKPNRLERARLEIADLMAQLEGDEIGIVLFSGASFLQVPLTSDYLTALNYLDHADPGVISRPGTVIGDAIRTAQSGFDPNLSNQKVLIVMTDGEDHETDPLSAAQEAAEADIMIYAIGFGTPEGEPIPEIDASGNIIGYKLDQGGNEVISQLREDTLRSIAETGNGKYYRATASGEELTSLLSEISSLQRANLQSRVETRMIERYQLFLVIGLIALLMSEILPESNYRRTAADQSRGRKFAFRKHVDPRGPENV